jgi:hypothetical protein
LGTFCFERIGCVEGVPAEWPDTLIRGDRFGAVTEFSARAGYQLDVTVNTTRLSGAWSN